ncbi:MAG: hypothetical protein ACLR23_10215 [Clostridia bacterium]
MHAGWVTIGSGRRAKVANSTPAQSRRTSTRRNGIKCTPAERRTAETSGQKVANSMPAQVETT